ncbi:hypothetical protein JW964_03200 [candidate division KSB1 bacterium]|nr:hypothetical protein [candidate division KSB1 bacterium]
MPILGKPYLSIKFSAETKYKPEEFVGDPSSIIPASILGNVISLTNELMNATWDYAWWQLDDERFHEFRKLEATGLIDWRNTELVVVSFNNGSIEAFFDWSVGLLGASSFWQNLPSNIAVEALWDLAKYSFQSLWQLIKHKEAHQPSTPTFKLTNELLPLFEQFVREAYKSLNDDLEVKSKIKFKNCESELSIIIDKKAQKAIFEANEINIEFATRLIGTIVGVDYSDGTIGVRYEQFPDQTIWSDIGELDFYEIEKLLPIRPKELPKKTGFDVEVAWRKGAAKVFPPDSIRILKIVPETEIKNLYYINKKAFHRIPVHEIKVDLNDIEQKFLRWLFWVDENWTSPNLSGIASYLSRRADVLGKRYDRLEVEKLVKYFVNLGILLRTRDSKRRNPSYQSLRLNRNHPVVIKYLKE